MSQTPLADDLYSGLPDRPRLLASRCRACGDHAFPSGAACARCSSSDVEVVELADHGTVWTWTSQEFRPPSPPYTGPETFERYYVGFVELADELYVEGRLTGFDGRAPEIGEGVELVMIPFRLDEAGDEAVIHAFAPSNATGGRADG
jgi:uncharacterized protein